MIFLILSRDEYVNFLIEMGREHWKDWRWWSGRLASRHSYTSPAFLYVCYVITMEKIFQKCSENQKIFVFCENLTLLRLLSHCFANKFEIEVDRSLLRDGRRKKSAYSFKFGEFIF